MTSALQQQHREFLHSQPSFLLELLSMPAPVEGWNIAAALFPGSTTQPAPRARAQRRRPSGTHFPNYPPWFSVPDSLPELVLPAPTTSTTLPAASLSASSARLNSAASKSLPSAPTSSMSSGSFSDAADQSHHHARPSSQPQQPPQPKPGPSDSTTANRKTPDGNPDDDEIQSLDSKKPWDKLEVEQL